MRMRTGQRLGARVCLICPLIVSMSVIGLLLWTSCICGCLFDENEFLHWMGFWSCANTGWSLICVAGVTGIAHSDLLTNSLIRAFCSVVRFVITFKFMVMRRIATDILLTLKRIHRSDL